MRTQLSVLRILAVAALMMIPAALPDPTTEPTIDGHETARIWGISYWTLLETVKRGDCPVMPLALGRKYRWPTKKVLELVGLA